ncbi:MAG: glycosyltransferase family 39 protein, partial [Patescibacteria group bacterium]
MFNNKKSLAFILTISLIVTLAYAFVYRVHPLVDARAYDQIAMNLVSGNGYREDADKPILYDMSIVRAGPGYEFFLAGLYAVFGHNYEAVWIAQALLHVLSAYLIYCIYERIFCKHATPPQSSSLDKLGTGSTGGGDFGALIAAALFAFWPDLIEISAMLMTETLYLLFVILTVYIFVFSFEKPQNRWLAMLFGLVTGLAILTRPTVLLFVPIIAFMYFRAKQYHSLMAYSLLLTAVLIPWTARNYGIYGDIIPTTLLAEFNLWLGNTLVSNGGQISGGYNPLDAYIQLNGATNLKEHAQLMFRFFVLEHPLLFLKLCAIRFIRFFSLIRPMGFWFYQSGIKQALFVGSSLIWIAGVFVAGFTGMALQLKPKHLSTQA